MPKSHSAGFARAVRATSLLTDVFPHLGAWLLDGMAVRSVGSDWYAARETRRAAAALERVRGFRRILVIADLNIGDAVLLQSSLIALRDFFPDAELDYAVATAAAPLLLNGAATGIHPVFRGRGVPAVSDVEAVRALAVWRRPDVVFNFCPFLLPGELAPVGTPVVGPAALASRLIRAVAEPKEVAHVAPQVYGFVHSLLAPLAAPCRAAPFAGVTITISADAAERATALLRARRQRPGAPLVVVNPDASSRFTRMPLEMLRSLVRETLSLPCEVMLGAGHAEPGLEARVLEGLSPAQRARVGIIPASVPLEVYAALLDAADVFVSADTGPLHIAAARKRGRSPSTRFRNRTAVVSVFGATPARLYGYASRRAGFFATHQDAPSSAHVCGSPCRNLSCIHKTAKTCRAVRCFDQPGTDSVIEAVASCLAEAWAPATA